MYRSQQTTFDGKGQLLAALAEESLFQHEALELAGAISELNAKEKVILSLLFFERLTMEQVASVLDLEVEEVDFSKRLALSQLTSLLNPRSIDLRS